MRRADLLAVQSAMLLLVALLVPTEGTAQPGPGADRDESNHIELVVDGGTVKIWAVKELMEGRFDWESPKGQVYPVVPLTFVLAPEERRLPLETIGELTVVGNGRVTLSGDDLELLPKLLLKLDIERGGTWQLVGGDAASADRLDRIMEPRRLRRVDRLEVSTRRE